MRRFFAVLLVLFFAGAAHTQTQVQFGLQTGSNPRALGVYDQTHTFVPFANVDSTGHTLTFTGPATLSSLTIAGYLAATTSGTLTNGHCVAINATGNLVDAGAACTTGGGAAGQIAYYVSSGTVVSGAVTGTGVLTALGNTAGAAGGFALQSSLGTAAVQNIGTSGAVVPLLSTSATWMTTALDTAFGSTQGRTLSRGLSGWASLQATTTAQQYGAIADGASHPLSSKYGTLAAAQADYPFATSLTQEIDYCAIMAAQNAVAPWTWQGGTRATELSGVSGTVYLPAGKYVLGNVKFRLNAGVRLLGDAAGWEFPTRNGSGGIGWTGGSKAGGTTLYSTYTGTQSNGAPGYAFDTSPWNASGARDDDYLQTSLDSYNGTHTQVGGIVLENLTLYGNWTSFGLNMAGAENARLKNVFIKGFHYGVRWSGSWYSSMEDVQVYASYRGMGIWMSVTELALFNCSFNQYAEGNTYNPALTGRDPSDPPTTAYLTQGTIDAPAGILSYYGNVTGFKTTIESYSNAFLSMNSVDFYTGTHIESITSIILRLTGPDQQNGYYDFDAVVSSASAGFIWADQCRVTVVVHNTNYTQASYGYLLSFINTTGVRDYSPVVRGLSLTPTDITNGVTTSQFRNIADDYSTGTFTPILNFGGNTAGTQVGNGGWWTRIGNRIFVDFSIQVPTLSGNTGTATISGLPFPSEVTGYHPGGGPVLFAYAAPAGANVWVQPNSSSALIVNNTGASITNASFSNGADIRGTFSYQITTGK